MARPSRPGPGQIICPVHLAEQGTGHCITTFALGYDRSLVPAPRRLPAGGAARRGWPPSIPDEVRPQLGGRRHRHCRRPPRLSGTALHGVGPLRPSAGHRRVGPTSGYTPKVGIEFEAYVLEPDGEGGWQRWQTPPVVRLRHGPLGRSSGADRRHHAHCLAARVSRWRASTPSTTSRSSELTLEYDDAPQGRGRGLLVPGAGPGGGPVPRPRPHVPGQAVRGRGRQRGFM